MVYVFTPTNSVRLKKKYSSKELKWFIFLFQYTTEDLLDQIQASEEELMAQLQVLNACEIGGSIAYYY